MQEWWCIIPLFSRLIADLKKAQIQGHLERRWQIYLRPALLVIDEVGYMQLNRQEAELLFRLISERYEHGSVILTSSKYFNDWGELLEQPHKISTITGTSKPVTTVRRSNGSKRLV